MYGEKGCSDSEIELPEEDEWVSKEVTMWNGRQGGNHGEVDFRSCSKATSEVEIISRWPQESGAKGFTVFGLAASASPLTRCLVRLEELFGPRPGEAHSVVLSKRLMVGNRRDDRLRSRSCHRFDLKVPYPAQTIQSQVNLYR